MSNLEDYEIRVVPKEQGVRIKLSPYQTVPEKILKVIGDNSEGSEVFAVDRPLSRQIKESNLDPSVFVPDTPNYPRVNDSSDLKASHDLASMETIHEPISMKARSSQPSIIRKLIPHVDNTHDQSTHNITKSTALPGRIISNTIRSDLKIRQGQESYQSFETKNSVRLTRVNEACAKFGRQWRRYKPQAEFYYSQDHKLMYCKVAKGGCTFWEQLYSFILRPESMKKENFTTIYEIPRWRIHFDKNITPPAFYWSDAKTFAGENVTRFMFTRDPFSRIWSAYIDKLWLPDFWYWMRIKNHTSLPYTDRCLYDVTFADFVEFISMERNSNKHWAPVHQSCNPCVFKPHILGNMSSFAEDTRRILNKGNLEYILSQYSYDMRVRNEVTMLVQYNYERLRDKSRLYTFCEFTSYDLAYRLWLAFQMNGYISMFVLFPYDLKNFKEKTVLNAVHKAISQKPLSHDESSAQRKYFLRQAFQSVPRSIMKQMINRFEADFLLFGFDRDPDYLLKDGEKPKSFDWLMNYAKRAT